jgi:beta-xylosidase
MTPQESSLDVTATTRPWSDVRLPQEERVSALISQMSLREKVAQLYGTWVGATQDGEAVAPHQKDMQDEGDFDALLSHGLGQLTRPFGTAPIDAAVGAASLVRLQRRVAAANRFGIPALVHEECLAGFTSWGATIYPVPLSWGATFHPELIAEMGARIGTSLRSVGVHQGLAPVLDVTRDARWGRTEETIGEDPYLVGTIATAYVRGLESTGIVATLKHFAGYSASKAARNLAPVSMGPREFADTILPPFEMAVRESGVRSVMHSYASVDGVPAASNGPLLTTLLRDEWGFTGTVVADYFGVGFLKLLHGVAGTWGEAGALALKAGVDVELPSANAYAQPLVDEVIAGRLDVGFIDRALERVLRQKLELGLLDADWNGLPPGWTEDDLVGSRVARGTVNLDRPEDRALARRIAEEAIVLLSNDGILPLGSSALRIAVIGPCADDAMTMMGCYSFPSHVGVHHPELPLGLEFPTFMTSIADELPDSSMEFSIGCTISGTERDGFASAVKSAERADIAIIVLGDRAGLFGRGTSGEGCDAESLELPGVQADLLERVLDSGTPVILVVDSGRPYFLGTAPERARAIVQAFFPGEEGGAALAGVISGRVNPSGRLPVSVPAHPGAQPSTYLGPPLAQLSEVSNINPTAAYGFGHGLGYTTFDWSGIAVNGLQADADAATLGTDGMVTLAVSIRNAGKRAGTEIVQLYLHDPVASVVQPVIRLIGYARVELEPEETAAVVFDVPADAASFTGIDGRRVVEPGELEFRIARSSAETEFSVRVEVTGEPLAVDHLRRLHCDTRIVR